ncbi:uncharacterized protein TNCV_2649951 [Trichonephila clavipes]|nr:uncharacterized protein TNCV_2649951 [Trichonephila clavipes]
MLNIPYPSKCTYRQHEIKLLHAASQAANNSMLESAKSIAECSNECGVSVDGTWQKRGYSSLNGCVSTISVDSGKILDIEVLSQYCRVCTKTEKTSGFSKKSVVSHFCKNHKGSASNMETVGVYRIFERSEANRSLRYTSYYGDGDSKAFNNVKDIYGYDSVVKYECIGHVQKRVGSRLRKLKKCTKGLGGKEARKLIVAQLSQTYAQAAKTSTLNNSTQTDENITKIKCPPLKLLEPLSSKPRPNISISAPDVSRSSSSTQAQLLPSTSSIAATNSEPQPPIPTSNDAPSTNDMFTRIESSSSIIPTSSSKSVIQPPSDSNTRFRWLHIVEEYTTDEEDMITYDVEEDEIEPHPVLVEKDGKQY